MGSSLWEEPICCGLGSYVAVRVLLVYEGLLHYFLPYLCHYSPVSYTHLTLPTKA